MKWAFLRQQGVDVRENAKLSEFTTFRLGGPCPAVLTCEEPEQLVLVANELAKTRTDFVLVGGGSNLLVSDAGLEQVVVRYRGTEAVVRHEDDLVEVSGCMLLDDLAYYAVSQGLGGLVYASGIPGTVGGAVAGNAGAFGKQIGDGVESVLLLDRTGRLWREPGDKLEFAYRRSRLQQSGEMVVSVSLRLEPAPVEELRQKRREVFEVRRLKHPDWRTVPTAGSFFRNIEPTSAADRRQAAGWYLEQAGAKQMKVGGAHVFDQHANIIVADPGCTAQDVLDLSRQMAAAVKQRFGIELTPEVRVLGRFR